MPDMRRARRSCRSSVRQTLAAEGISCQATRRTAPPPIARFRPAVTSFRAPNRPPSRRPCSDCSCHVHAVSATSTASAHGGGERPLDVMVLLDTTGSMRNDAQSGVCPRHDASKLDCAKAGVSTLLQNLQPCPPASRVAARRALDRVGLMAFPPLTDASLRTNETGGPGTHSHGSCTLSSSEVKYDDTGTTTSTSSATQPAQLPTARRRSARWLVRRVSPVGSSISGSGIPSARPSRPSTRATLRHALEERDQLPQPRRPRLEHDQHDVEHEHRSDRERELHLHGRPARELVRLAARRQLAAQPVGPARRGAEHVEQLQPAGALDLGYVVRDRDRPGSGGPGRDGRLRPRTTTRSSFSVTARRTTAPSTPRPTTPRQPVPVDSLPAGGGLGSGRRGTDHRRRRNRPARNRDLRDRLLGEHPGPGHGCNAVVGTDSRGRACNDDTGNLDPQFGYGDTDQFDCYETAQAGASDPAGVCDQESRPITGCWTMAHIASDASTFFQDPATPTSRRSSRRSLPTTAPRLLPDNTQ